MATKREMLERKEAIYDALDTNEKTGDFIERLAKEWRCSPSAIRRQYREVMDELAESSDERREDIRTTLLERARKYENIAFGHGNVKLALDALEKQAKISGCYNPPKAVEEKKEKVVPIFQYEETDNSTLVLVEDEDKVSGE